MKEHEVHILSTGGALKLLKGHFGDRCTYYDVPSIYTAYTRTRLFKLNFSLSIPRMVWSLRRARRRSKAIIDRGFDRVISDCRYDVYGSPQNSYLVNHQLRFKAPAGAQRILERWLASRMRKYRYVLVPDYEDRNLTGILSHDLRYVPREKVKYVGILSHLRQRDVPEDIDYFISLSGPEPQRRVLEKLVMRQVGQLQGRVVIAGGRPQVASQKRRDNVEYYSFLDAARQEDVMNRAEFVVTRSGYTTLMELAELNKSKVLLLPTPGQTEQEYLADYCERQNYFHHVSQYRLKSSRALSHPRHGTGFLPPWKTQESVARFLDVVYS